MGVGSMHLLLLLRLLGAGPLAFASAFVVVVGRGGPARATTAGSATRCTAAGHRWHCFRRELIGEAREANPLRDELRVGRRLLQHEIESLELVFQPLVFFLFGRFALRFLVRGVVFLKLSVIFEPFLVGAALHLYLGGFHFTRDRSSALPSAVPSKTKQNKKPFFCLQKATKNGSISHGGGEGTLMLLLIDKTEERGGSIAEREFLSHLVHVRVLVAVLVFVRLESNDEMGNNHNTEASSGVVAVGMVAVGAYQGRTRRPSKYRSTNNNLNTKNSQCGRVKVPWPAALANPRDEVLPRREGAEERRKGVVLCMVVISFALGASQRLAWLCRCAKKSLAEKCW